MQFSPPPDIDSLPTRLPPLTSHDRDKMLPSLSSVTGDVRLDRPPPSGPPSHWPSLNGSMAYRQPPPPSQQQQQQQQPDSPANMDVDGSSVTSTATPPAGADGPNALSIDDPDVRLAAEALGDLRADFVSSPPDSGSLPPMSPQTMAAQAPTSSRNSRSPQQSEPLLSLLTTSHPLISSTIGGASSAYGGAKNFSPRFKSGAEYVEGYLTPIANTVNSVGRATGVEGGVRWFLGAGRRHAAPTDEDGGSKKRRKMGGSGETSQGVMEQARDLKKLSELTDSPSSDLRSPRRLSSASTVDTLPAYDDMRSPAYTETDNPQSPPRSNPSNAPWQSRLIMSTSGLSVAMSAESLRSLKYCLKWLRWSNDHMGRVIGNLKSALEEYEKVNDEVAEGQGQDGNDEPLAAGQKTPQESRVELANKINTLKGDVLKTLQDSINTVSKYAGGALPENARTLVRRHLTSLPQRFRVATMTSSPEGGAKDSDSAIREGAQKVLVLAKEGLDMVTQITGVVDGTIVSAEEWCERMGKKRRPSTDEDRPLPPTHETNGDVKMG
ncbi:transcriptional regulator opi1 [Purpureocillium takamizusanense]|uniref:Transcriptional regulator opi1 n=1 Tax=Purpureocillium takamizusanense TaxID=2060973 RepID=A0A9Q8QIS6_9HYPO|nr:transcriptional regulator opi1 [Purpureocillium takamizusanense]UNI19574.1 transcriptional regulator opi1 [Purpureocillium takamizusanense]